MIKVAEIVLYNENDDTVSFQLSAKQLEAVCKILGLSLDKNGLNCFSDESLQRVMDITINRLKGL